MIIGDIVTMVQIQRFILHGILKVTVNHVILLQHITTAIAHYLKNMVTKMTTSTPLRWFYPLSFFIGICYIIFLADTADYNFAFHMVGQIPYGDKICHALLYGMMALLLNYGLGFRKFHTFQVGSIIVLTFATLEEFSQYFIPSRTFDFGDLLGWFLFHTLLI